MAAASTGSSLQPWLQGRSSVDVDLNGISGQAFCSTIGNYECICVIGKGSYGEVWKAKCRFTGRQVALKMIHSATTSDGFPRTALREVRMLKQLNHPNIVNLIDVVVTSQDDVAEAKKATYTGNGDAVQAGAVYLVYEYASYDFTGLLDGSLPLSPAAIRSYTYQLLAGLAHLHDDKVRIVHRDIKCSNILLTEENTVKIADFGLARRFEKHMGRASRPMTTNVITLWYRPPELLLGATAYDSRVDVWSAGCIVMELLIGKPLFRGNTDSVQLGLIFKLLGTPGPHSSLRQLPNWGSSFKESPSRLRAEIKRLCDSRKLLLPPAAVDLMESLLCLDPRQRPLAADAMRHPWFTTPDRTSGEPPINPARPAAGLPPVSQLAGLDPALDYHEYAARERKREKRAAAEGGGSSKRDRGSKRSAEEAASGGGSKRAR